MFSLTSKVKTIILFCFITFVISFTYFGFRYITNLESELQISENNVNTLKSTINDQTQLIRKKEQEYQQILAVNKKLNLSINNKNKEMDELLKTFNSNASGDSRDIGKLAISKPLLIQNIINDGTRTVIECLNNTSNGVTCEN